MGRLLYIHPCQVCNYHVEDELHEGGSGSAGLFLRNHYVLAICADCHHLVSALVANSSQETDAAVTQARHDLVQLEADAVIGDFRARDLLPLFRQALDTLDSGETAPATACTMCGSANIALHPVAGELFDEQTAWVPCPRCEEGRLLVETAGHWD
jgi:hypothetical protein